MAKIDKWEDFPIFGEVPLEFREWYSKSSGTFYRENGGWCIDADLCENLSEFEAWLRGGSRGYKITKKYKADTFQNLMIISRETIKSKLREKNIDKKFGNKEIFSLMRNGFVDITYEFNGFDCIEHITE